jgi:hypothetical protein
MKNEESSNLKEIIENSFEGKIKDV